MIIILLIASPKFVIQHRHILLEISKYSHPTFIAFISEKIPRNDNNAQLLNCFLL